MALVKLPFRALALTLAISAAHPVYATALDPGWPREIVRNDTTLIYYQPQIEDWKDFKEVTGRMAVSITPKGGKPQVGVVTLQAQSDVDVDSRNALLSNPRITGTSFPGADPATSQKLDQIVREFLNPDASLILSMDRLVASVEDKKTPAVAEVKNDPPTIFVSYSPAMLLYVDGEPALAPIKDSALSSVVNANWPLFFEPVGHQYFLFTGQSWMTSTDLKSGWSETKALPSSMSKVPADPAWADLKPFIPPVQGQKIKTPGVFYSSPPAALITFDGPPVYTKIQGTELVYAKNTESNVFVFSPTGTFYYLNAGRWYSAPGPGGPWTFATNQLPTDFAKIPRNSDAAWVLASVPGTPEAADAVLLAQIPTTVEVNPAAAAKVVKVVYDGEPKFQPIEGTVLSYATNTPDKVIKVDNRYYACTQGVWFDAASPSGPWQTSASVPPAIYTIPPSSPVYNVTYVTQQTTSTGSVQASYTAGYFGAFIVGAAVGAIIAQGNGYYYPPYIGWGGGRYPAYYPRPVPYAYNTYNSHTGASGMVRGAYGPNGAAQWGVSYNPHTGTYGRSAAVSGRYGSGAIGQAYNPYTGVYGATRQGSNAYGQWGSSVVTNGNQWAATQHRTTTNGTVGTYHNSEGAKAVAGANANGRVAVGKAASGDVYAGRDGNVYRNTGGDWQKYDDGTWSSVNKPAPQGEQQKAVNAKQARAANTASTQAKTQPAQKQRAASVSGANSPSTQPRARTVEQRPAPSPNKPDAGASQRSGGAYGGSGTQASLSQLNQDRQNRQRGAAQIQRFNQSQRGGGHLRRER